MIGIGFVYMKRKANNMKNQGKVSLEALSLKDLMELNKVISELRAEKTILIKQVKTALHWMTDVRLQMRTQGHGWIDASDSLRIAEKTLEEILK
jgi:hypothetical protein